MRKLPVVLIVMLIVAFFLIGCSGELEKETPLEKEIVKNIEEQKPVEQIVEKIVKEKTEEKIEPTPAAKEERVEIKPEEKLVETKPQAAEKIKEEKSVEPKADAPKLGRVTQLNPPKDNVYTGEITAYDSAIHHYKFTSLIPIIRGDIVTFTLDADNLATILKKEEGTKMVKQTTTRDDEQPAGTLLGRIKSVVTSRDGGFDGRVVNTATGKDYRYHTMLPLVVNDEVYYGPGTEPVQIIKKIEIKRASR